MPGVNWDVDFDEIACICVCVFTIGVAGLYSKSRVLRLVLLVHRSILLGGAISNGAFPRWNIRADRDPLSQISPFCTRR